MAVLMTIDGGLVAGRGVFAVDDPATGMPFAEAPACSDVQLDFAARTADRAYPAWRRDAAPRRAALLAAAARIEEHLVELAVLFVREQGMPVSEAKLEIAQAIQCLRYYGELDIPAEVLQDDEHARVELLHDPIGPVAAITPWNAPVGLAFWKVAPALRAGNTVVVKPSPYTPLTTLRIGELLADVFPPGVLSVISGPDPLGTKLSAHPAIRRTCFTGAAARGRNGGASEADRAGGNDPAIVLADADIDTAAAGIFGSAMTNVGQICVAPKRVFVHRSVYGDFVSALVERAEAAQLGSGLDPEVSHGPVNNAAQLRRVTTLVEQAVRAGAKVAAGGGTPVGGGFFHAPTILTGVEDGMPVVAEEQFGPVLPVLPYDTIDEVVGRVNATHFGSGSSVWTVDAQRGARVARAITAGTTWVNWHLYMLPDLPFGGPGHGARGLREFSTPHVVYQNLVPGSPWS